MFSQANSSLYHITDKHVSDALAQLLKREQFKPTHLWLVLAYRVVERERPSLFGKNYSKIPAIDRKATKENVGLLTNMRNRVIHPANRAKMTTEQFKRVFVWFNIHFETGWPEAR